MPYELIEEHYDLNLTFACLSCFQVSWAAFSNVDNYKSMHTEQQQQKKLQDKSFIRMAGNFTMDARARS